MPASLGMQGRPAQLRAGRGGGGGRPGEGYRWAQRGRSRAQRGARRGAAARSRREPPMAAASHMPAPPGGEKGPPLIGRAVLTHRRRSELCSALLRGDGEAAQEGLVGRGGDPARIWSRKIKVTGGARGSWGKARACRWRQGKSYPLPRLGKAPVCWWGGTGASLPSPLSSPPDANQRANGGPQKSPFSPLGLE